MTEASPGPAAPAAPARPPFAHPAALVPSAAALCAAALLGGPATVAAVAVSVTAWCALAAGSPRRALARLGPLVLAFALLLPFALAGGLPVAEAVGRGFLVSATLVTASLAATWPEVLGALQGLGAPRVVLALLAVALRHVDTLQGDALQAWRTLASRGGLDGFAGSWRSLRVLTVHLSVRAFERADRVADALASRGFEGRFFPPVFRRPGAPELAALGAAALSLAAWAGEVLA